MYQQESKKQDAYLNAKTVYEFRVYSNIRSNLMNNDWSGIKDVEYNCLSNIANLFIKNLNINGVYGFDADIQYTDKIDVCAKIFKMFVNGSDTQRKQEIAPLAQVLGSQYVNTILSKLYEKYVITKSNKPKYIKKSKEELENLIGCFFDLFILCCNIKYDKSRDDEKLYGDADDKSNLKTKYEKVITQTIDMFEIMQSAENLKYSKYHTGDEMCKLLLCICNVYNGFDENFKSKYSIEEVKYNIPPDITQIIDHIKQLDNSVKQKMVFDFFAYLTAKQHKRSTNPIIMPIDDAKVIDKDDIKAVYKQLIAILGIEKGKKDFNQIWSASFQSFNSDLEAQIEFNKKSQIMLEESQFSNISRNIFSLIIGDLVGEFDYMWYTNFTNKMKSKKNGNGQVLTEKNMEKINTSIKI